MRGRGRGSAAVREPALRDPLVRDPLVRDPLRDPQARIPPLNDPAAGGPGPRPEASRRIPRDPGAWDAERAQAALNVLGGVAFSFGSLLFLDRALMPVGIGLFVLGSFAMAAGAIAVWRQRYARPRADRVRRTAPGAEPEAFPPLVEGAPAGAPLAASAATEVGEPQVEELYLRAS